VLPWQLPANDATDENFRQRMTTSLAGFRKKTRKEKPGKSFESRGKTMMLGKENENTVTRFYFYNFNILRKFL